MKMSKQQVSAKKDGKGAQKRKERRSVFELLFGNTISKARGIIMASVIARTF